MPFPYTFPFDFDTEDFTIRIAFDSDPFDDSPRWVDIGSIVYSGTITRGRQHELNRIEAGVATLIIDNSSGDFWPDNTSGQYYGNLLPGKRINIRKIYNATAYDVFTGFIESYTPRFLSRGGKIPVCEITAVDLFKNLALTELNERVADFAFPVNLTIADNAALSMGDIDFSIAAWVYLDDKSASRPIVAKSENSTNMEYQLGYNLFLDRFTFHMSSGGSVATAQQAYAGASSPSTGAWHFVVGYYDATNNVIACQLDNGTPGTIAHSGGAYDGTSAFRLGEAGYGFIDLVKVSMDGRIGPVGIWKRLLTETERTTLYNNARTKLIYADLTSSLKTSLVAWWDNTEESGSRADSAGANTLTEAGGGVGSVSEYPSELSNVRIGRVLDNVGWPSANRDLDTGAVTLQTLTPVSGVIALTHLHAIEESEKGLVLVQGDGDVEFQNRTARANAPYAASQATFGDDPGEMVYADIEVAYDDQYIYNDVRLTRTGGIEQVAGDVDSQNTYGKRTLTKTGLLQSADADVLTVAGLLRDKYKAPSVRVASITIDPTGDPANLWPKVLSYGISTRITVRLNDASIDSEFHIEGIRQAFSPKKWQTKWQLSKAS